MSTEQFWQYPISQGYGHNHETGTDYQTPFHTPLFAPWGGVVTHAGYHDWGGEVDYKGVVPNHPELGVMQFTILHEDEIDPNIRVGLPILPGQYVGKSGGENPGYPGAEHPAKRKYSTGPHTEFDMWEGPPWASHSIDPNPYLQSLGHGGGGFGNPLSGLAGDIAAGVQAGLSGAANDVANAGSNAIKGLGDAFLKTIGVGSLDDLLWRFGLVTVGGIIFVMGVAIFLGKYGPAVVDNAAQKVQQGSSMAASVAAFAA